MIAYSVTDISSMFHSFVKYDKSQQDKDHENHENIDSSAKVTETLSGKTLTGKTFGIRDSVKNEEMKNVSHNVLHNVSNNKCMVKNGRALSLATTKTNEKNDKLEKLQKKIGIDDEEKMLDAYEKSLDKKITCRNDQLYTITVNYNNQLFKIYGKIDGMITEDNIIVEHKRRIRGFLQKIPVHEIIQCHLYMKMTGCKCTHLLETFGNHQKITIINFDEEMYQYILRKLTSIDNMTDTTTLKTSPPKFF